MTREIVTRGVEETVAFGGQLAADLGPGAVVGVCGELGAGKTCLVRGLARGLGFDGLVTSPTFTLIHEYRGGRLPLFHADLYRLRDAAEADELGLEEYFGAGGVTVVEWADRFPGLLPGSALWIRIAHAGPEERKIAVA